MDDPKPKEQKLEKYIMSYSERSDGPQCNGDYVCLVESPIFPTEQLIIDNGLVIPGTCTNVSYPGCEECGGSKIVDFRVEFYSPERAKELKLITGTEKESEIKFRKLSLEKRAFR